jgi:hypothetical protein
MLVYVDGHYSVRAAEGVIYVPEPGRESADQV